MNLRARLPDSNEIFCVYSLVVFLEYSWAFFAFFYTLPSWLLGMPFSEIIWAFFYAIFFTFFDSALLFILVLICAILLPATWIRDKFASRGGMLALTLFVWSVLVQAGFITQYNWIIPSLLFIALHTFGMVLLTARVPALQRFMDGFVNRAGIFVYLYPPLSLIGFVVTLIRNI